MREENECTIEDASGKNRKKISSKEARAILTIDALRDATARQLDLIHKLEAAAQQDGGSESTGEFERLRARLEDLGNEKHRLELKVISLENDIKDLMDARQPASLIDALTAALAAIEANGEGKAAKAANSAIRALLAELQKPVKTAPAKKTIAPPAEAIAAVNDPNSPYYIPPECDRTRH